VDRFPGKDHGGQAVTYTDKEIARVARAANAELQALHGDPAPSLPGDPGDAEAHAVTVAGIRAILGGATPGQVHETWMRAREAQGWTRGPRKDSRLKTHPALVPYGKLPECQRVKDRVFAAIVLAMSAQEPHAAPGPGELQVLLDNERAERLHRAGERDEARSDLRRMHCLALDVLATFPDGSARARRWRERADAIIGRHSQPHAGLPS
jgi:hypothetical protein